MAAHARVRAAGRGPAAPGPRRPVSAGRLRLAAAALTGVTGALAATVWLAQAAGREPVLALARPVTAGQLITAADLRVVRVSAAGTVSLVPSSLRDQVTGRTAAASLPAGSLLAAADIGAPAPPRGQAQLGVALKPGRYPPGLSPGQHVEVLATGPGGARPAGQGIVLSPGTPPRGAAGQAVVELQLPQQELPQVAAAAAAGQVTLAAVPAERGTR